MEFFCYFHFQLKCFLLAASVCCIAVICLLILIEILALIFKTKSILQLHIFVTVYNLIENVGGPEKGMHFKYLFILEMFNLTVFKMVWFVAQMYLDFTNRTY